jgi:hypothetical protein
MDGKHSLGPTSSRKSSSNEATPFTSHRVQCLEVTLLPGHGFLPIAAETARQCSNGFWRVLNNLPPQHVQVQSGPGQLEPQKGGEQLG